jgi:hypothetical protein
MGFQCGLKHKAVQVNYTSVVQQNTRRFSFYVDGVVEMARKLMTFRI